MNDHKGAKLIFPALPQAPGYLSKPLASVGWQENCFREPQNT